MNNEIRLGKILPLSTEDIEKVIRNHLGELKIPVLGIKVILVNGCAFAVAVTSDITGNHWEHWTLQRGIPKLIKSYVTPVSCRLRLGSSMNNTLSPFKQIFENTK